MFSLLAHEIRFRTLLSAQPGSHALRSPGAKNSRVEVLSSYYFAGKLQTVFPHHYARDPISVNPNLGIIFSCRFQRPRTHSRRIYHPRSLRERAIYPTLRGSKPIPDEHRRQTSHLPSNRTLNPLPKEVPQCSSRKAVTAIMVSLPTAQLHCIPHMSLSAPSFRHLLTSTTIPPSRSTQRTFSNICRYYLYIYISDSKLLTVMDLGIASFFSSPH